MTMVGSSRQPDIAHTITHEATTATANEVARIMAGHPSMLDRSLSDGVQ
jgi:hypothetical protein